MAFYFVLVFNSVMLGVGLAMDAFSVSLANGFADSKMSKTRRVQMALTYAVFQFAMPVIGWFLVHNAATFFEGFQKFIPWIALILLGYIGIKMIVSAVKNKDEEESVGVLTAKVLFIQGIATSIDALSAGFTIAEYGLLSAVLCALIIALVTFLICIVGLIIGKKVGNKFSTRAQIFGGIILIGIGLEIFISNMIK